MVILINMPDKNTDPIAKAPEPVIQLAMLDIVGETRGAGNETVKSFKDAWPQAAYENYSEMDPAREWREQWDDDSKTPQVKILYDVTEAEITYLVLGRTKITDVGLKEVAKLRQLTLLDLTGTQITDAGLKEVAKLQKLKELDLTNAKTVTKEGVAELQKALPKCKISHDFE